MGYYFELLYPSNDILKMFKLLAIKVLVDIERFSFWIHSQARRTASSLVQSKVQALPAINQLPNAQVGWPKSGSPIFTIQEDVLGRAPFAKDLANLICSWNNPDSLVIGIYGPWGTGKSSFKNLIAQNIEILNGDGKPSAKRLFQVMELAPWNWSGTDHITTSLLKEIGKGLSNINDTELNESYFLWRREFADLELHRSFLTGVQKLLPLVIYLISSFLGMNLSQSSGWWIVTATTVLLLIYGLWDLLHRSTLTWLEAMYEYDKRPLEIKKAQIKRDLIPHQKRLIVFVDDIDRLTHEEIRLLFRVVKENVDLSRIIFVLLFDYDVVCSALSKEFEGDNNKHGARFLEKIIQVGFHLPKTETIRLESQIQLNLRQLIKDADLKFDWDRFNNYSEKSFFPFFRHLRDELRFFNSYNFLARMLAKHGDTFVNMNDLLLVEALRTFEPRAYHLLSKSRGEMVTLVNSPTGYFNSSKKGERNPDWIDHKIDALRESFSEENRAAGISIFQSLFPNLGDRLGIFMAKRDDMDGWFKSGNICHPSCFDRYFLFGAASGDFTREDVINFVSTISSDGFEKSLEKLIEDETLDYMLKRMDRYDVLPDQSNLKEFMLKLCNIYDKWFLHIPNYKYTVSVDDPKDLPGEVLDAIRVFKLALKKIPNELNRADIIEQSISESTGIFLPIACADSFARPVHTDEDPVIQNTELRTKIYNLQSKIFEKSIVDGRLLQHPALKRLLANWKGFDSTAQSAWMQKLLSNKNETELLLKAFPKLGPLRNIPDGVYVVDIEILEQFVSRNDVESARNAFGLNAQYLLQGTTFI